MRKIKKKAQPRIIKENGITHLNYVLYHNIYTYYERIYEILAVFVNDYCVQALICYEDISRGKFKSNVRGIQLNR